MNIVMMVILSPWPDKRFQGGFYSFYLEIIIIWLRKSVFFTIIIMKIMNHKWCKLLLFNFDDGENISTIITTPNSYDKLFETKSDSKWPPYGMAHTPNSVDISGALFKLRILYTQCTVKLRLIKFNVKRAPEISTIFGIQRLPITEQQFKNRFRSTRLFSKIVW